MADLLRLGFEEGHTGRLTTVSGAVVSTTQARTGTYSLRLPNEDNYADKVFSAAGVVEIYGRVACYPTSNVYRTLFKFYDHLGNIQFSFTRNTISTLLEIRIGDYNGTILATGTTPIPINAQTLIRFRLKIDNAVGVCKARIDGDIDEIDFSGDTQQSANANVSLIRIGTFQQGVAGYYDDIAINDTTGAQNNSWPHRGGIVGIHPTGAGTTTQMTPSAGSNWDCVDEVPPSDADYVEEATVDEKDTYAMGDLPLAGTIATVHHIIRAGLSAAGTGNLARVMRVGGVDYQGADFALTTSPVYYDEAIELSPNTGVAWTKAEVDAMESGQVCR